MGYQTPQEQYASKLTTPEKAVAGVANGSILCLALGMPSGLARAVANRVQTGALKDLNLLLPTFDEVPRGDADSTGRFVRHGCALFFPGRSGPQSVSTGHRGGTKIFVLRAV
jgi:acyl-CoA hydrolase